MLKLSHVSWPGRLHSFMVGWRGRVVIVMTNRFGLVLLTQLILGPRRMRVKHWNLWLGARRRKRRMKMRLERDHDVR